MILLLFSPEPRIYCVARADNVNIAKETLKKCVSLANDAHGRTEEGASPCASGAGKRFNQRFLNYEFDLSDSEGMNPETEKPYWVAFNHISGIGAVRSGLLQKRFGSLEEAWGASKAELLQCGIPEKTADQVLAFRDRTDPGQLMESILSRKISICIRTEPEYPRLLKEIDNPPPVLYYVGKLPPQGMKLMAIVGTRKMTAYGQNVASELGTFLTENGIGGKATIE